MSETAPIFTDFLPGGPQAPGSDPRPNLMGMDRNDLAAALAPLGVEGFRARQVFKWIYNRGVTDFAEMTDLSKALRAALAERFRIERLGIATERRSTDGTRKWLVRFDDGQEAESVHIPESDRGTLCVSSQVGCTLACSFCHTGTQKLVRNLETAEVVGQIMLARDAFDEWPSPSEHRQLTNIVMMGMGEPLYNFENVKKALKIAMDPEGLAVSRRKITLSTSGVAPMMRRCGEEIGVMLAVSLHAVRDRIRDELVPINRKWPIAELLDACRAYAGLSNARRITFEYVMLKGLNDSQADARELARLLAGIPSKINLIPFNPWPGCAYACSDDKTVKAFADTVNRAGYVVTVRAPRGRDILAACGQLKSESVRDSGR